MFLLSFFSFSHLTHQLIKPLTYSLQLIPTRYWYPVKEVAQNRIDTAYSRPKHSILPPYTEHFVHTRNLISDINYHPIPLTVNHHITTYLFLFILLNMNHNSIPTFSSSFLISFTSLSAYIYIFIYILLFLSLPKNYKHTCYFL